MDRTDTDAAHRCEIREATAVALHHIWGGGVKILLRAPIGLGPALGLKAPGRVLSKVMLSSDLRRRVGEMASRAASLDIRRNPYHAIAPQKPLLETEIDQDKCFSERQRNLSYLGGGHAYV